MRAPRIALVCTGLLAALSLALSAAHADLDADDLFAQAAEFHTSRDFVRALALAEAAAEKGHARAALMAGHILEDGLAGAVNDERAVKFYVRAAQAKDPDALLRLGMLARDSRGGLSPADASDFFDRAAELGHPDARHAQALHFLDPASPDHNPLLGLTMLRRAANEGRMNAQRDLGLALLDRAGVDEGALDGEPADIDEALMWLERAAQAGDLQAAYAAGVTLAGKDPIRSRTLLHMASEAGHGPAAGDLGWLLYMDGPTEDHRAASIIHLRRAALSGDPIGRFRLAWVLAEGEIVPQDLEDAYRWLLLAESAGLHHMDRLARDPSRLKYWLESRLTEEQMNRVEARVLTAQ